MIFYFYFNSKKENLEEIIELNYGKNNKVS